MTEPLGQQTFGGAETQAWSIFEQAKADLLDAFGGIQETEEVAAGVFFRNSVKSCRPAIRSLDQINQAESPEVGVHVGLTLISPADGRKGVFSGTADVTIQGVVSAADEPSDFGSVELQESLDSLAHDFKCVVAMIGRAKIQSGSKKWIILKDTISIVQFTDLGDKRNKASLIMTFRLKVGVKDEEFSA